MVTQIAAVCGVVFGFAGLVLSILNYFRDRPELVVALKWDMATTGDLKHDPNKLWGIVRVTNTGRRPIFLTAVALELPKLFATEKGFEHNLLVLGGSLGGKKLTEGDPPAVFVVTQDDLTRYSTVWNQIRAIAEDSTGRRYKSRKVSERPSWAEHNNPE